MAINKKAWIRVIEAFLSAMLVIVVIVLVVNQQQSNQTDYKTSQIYGTENSIIRAIELNNTLRGEIIGISTGSLPLNSENSSFPTGLANEINSKSETLTCQAQICNATSLCEYWKSSENAIYSQDVLITTTSTSYNPRKLKLFCWGGD